jgi:RNA polymerase sigma factor (sigma-70 family)
VSALLGVSREARSAAERTGDLYARHGQRVYSFCRNRLRNPEEAQDAAQTAFLYALASLRRGVIPRNELAWLLTIADNVCRASRRTLGRRLAHVANADVDELEAAAPSLNAETREQIAQLRAALEQLPDRQRQAILLREWQGLSYADIAEQLGLSLGAVETLLFRSRRSLMQRLRGSRARLGMLDLASGASLLRSVLGGTTAKVAVGAATLAVVAAPVAKHELKAPSATPAATARAGITVASTPHGKPQIARPQANARSVTSTRRAPAGRSVVSVQHPGRPTVPGASAAPPTGASGPASPPKALPSAPARDLPPAAQTALPPPVTIPSVGLPPVTVPVQVPQVVTDPPIPIP